MLPALVGRAVPATGVETGEVTMKVLVLVYDPRLEACVLEIDSKDFLGFLRLAAQNSRTGSVQVCQTARQRRDLAQYGNGQYQNRA